MKVLLLTMLLGGCAYDRYPLDEPYSRQEVDAINAETQCKLMARNLVQISRCEIRQGSGR